MERGFIFQLDDRERDRIRVHTVTEETANERPCRKDTPHPHDWTRLLRDGRAVGPTKPSHVTILHTAHGLAVSCARTRTSRLLASHHSSRDGRTRVPRSIASTTSRPTEDVGGTVYTRRGHTESSPRNKSNQGSLWDTHHEVQHDGSSSALRLRALARLASPSSAFFS